MRQKAQSAGEIVKGAAGPNGNPAQDLTLGLGFFLFFLIFNF